MNVLLFLIGVLQIALVISLRWKINCLMLGLMLWVILRGRPINLHDSTHTCISCMMYSQLSLKPTSRQKTLEKYSLPRQRIVENHPTEPTHQLICIPAHRGVSRP